MVQTRRCWKIFRIKRENLINTRKISFTFDTILLVFMFIPAKVPFPAVQAIVLFSSKEHNELMYSSQIFKENASTFFLRSHTKTNIELILLLYPIGDDGRNITITNKE